MASTIMKLSVALCASAVTAASIPSEIHTEGLPLSHFGQVESVTPEEAAAGVDLRFSLPPRNEPRAPACEGLPLEKFGNVHFVELEDAKAFKDLGGNNFSILPVFGPGHEFNLQSWLDKVGGELEDGLRFIASNLKKEAGAQASGYVTEAEESIAEILEGRDTGDCANPNIRFEWDDYTESDRQAFIGAIQCLMNKPPSGRVNDSANRYEDFVRLHQSYAPNIHSKSTTQQTHKFLLWHRYFLWSWEQTLRDECGFDRAMPWWDEKKWAGKFDESSLYTPDYFGSMTGPTNGLGTCIKDGGFAGLQSNLGPGFTVNNPHCVQRAVNEQLTAQTGDDAYNTCMARTSYPDFHSCCEFTFHAQGHNGVGATMADSIASVGDPAFFMHHTYVDYVFTKWQLAGPASRRTTISGCASNNGCPPLTLDTTVYLGQICGNKCPDLPVSQVLNPRQGHFCYVYNY
ncbi:hypothetical protein GGR50DRAFT_583973 [Xylaria sp. CBS 124048]|nr:hypothetical protein GGR50DRAFT_583973 [Xylaria sp. CBS 124048]